MTLARPQGGGTSSTSSDEHLLKRITYRKDLYWLHFNNEPARWLLGEEHQTTIITQIFTSNAKEGGICSEHVFGHVFTFPLYLQLAS